VPVTTVAARYVALAERIAASLGSPRVRALHLPPPSDAQAPAQAKVAEFCAVELDEGAFGFSYVWLDAVEPPLRARSRAAAFAGIDALDLARGFASADPTAKALGFAAINALSQFLFTRANWMPPHSEDSLGALAPARGEHIGMIGLFHPLLDRIATSGARLTVLELRPELAGEHDHCRVTLDPAELATCDKVVSTCTVLLNDTLDRVLAACRNARYFAIVGPTSGCLPDPLFERNVDAVGGRRVVDAAGFREAFRRGDKWGAFAAKYVIARPHYPGVDWLLDRVR
jgi:uncharacterized protein (DUF4213/DUF364 family)